MNLIDVLLETDVKKLQEGVKKELEIKRLSKKLGVTFAVTCHALTSEQVQYIGEISHTNIDIKLNAVLEGCKLESKKLNNSDLITKFNVATPKELIEKLFLPGEISILYDAINELSGYGNNSVKEIKNS